MSVTCMPTLLHSTARQKGTKVHNSVVPGSKKKALGSFNTTVGLKNQWSHVTSHTHTHTPEEAVELSLSQQYFPILDGVCTSKQVDTGSAELTWVGRKELAR